MGGASSKDAKRKAGNVVTPDGPPEPPKKSDAQGGHKKDPSIKGKVTRKFTRLSAANLAKNFVPPDAATLVH